MVAVEPMSRDELKQVCTVISTGKPGGSAGLSGVHGQGSSMSIKVQHGSLPKMDTGGHFGCSACWRE